MYQNTCDQKTVNLVTLSVKVNITKIFNSASHIPDLKTKAKIHSVFQNVKFALS